MSISIQNATKAQLLRAKVPLIGTWLLVAFSNNLTPTDTSTFADLTIDTNARFTPPTPAWGPAFVRDDGDGQMSSGNIDISKRFVGPPLLLYGWALVDEAGPTLKMAARFAGVVPKIVQAPFLFFRFRIDLLEATIT